MLQQWWCRIGVVLVLAVVTQATCPGSPWREWRGHCYRLTYQKVPWHGLRGDCKAFFRASDAASVTSRAENDFIKSLAGGKKVWLGMRSANNQLSWADGIRVRYRNFPGSRVRTKGAEDAVEMDGRTGRWQFAASHTAPAQRGVCKMASCSCPPGWTEWDRRCYKAVRRPLTWLEASAACRKMADTADLVSIINQRENNFVHGLLRQYPFWIGLNDREEEGKYISSSGENYPYRNWHKPSEPNGRNHSADCADMLVDKTWSDTPCGPNGPAKPFVCEKLICGRDKQIRPEPVKGRRFRVWRPEDGLRCPGGWSRSGEACYSQPTQADTFSGVQRLCSAKHPEAEMALVTSLEQNDRAFYASRSLPLWVDYGSRSGRARGRGRAPRVAAQDIPTFTYWAPGVALARSVDSDCAALQDTSQWRPRRCEQARLPGLCQLPACNPECPRGWVAHGGRCYRTVRRRLALAEAAAVCQRDGAHLASVQSQDENDFITTLAFKTKGVNYRADKHKRHVWIGATRADRSSAWSWADCDRWPLSRWMKGDGDDPALTSGTCATLFFNGRWRDDVSCTTGRYHSVCELDPCREQFGPADKTGCRTAKVIAPEPKPQQVPETPKVPGTTTVPATTAVPVTEPAEPTERFRCPPDWTELDGYCYHGIIEQDTFVNALRTCAEWFRPSHVASAHTPQQNQLILQLTGGGPTWLGLTSAYDFPEWRWFDGSDQADFQAWARGQPDSTRQNMKVCAAVNRRGFWEARSCVNNRHSFVCKLPAERVPAEPSCPDPGTWREEAGSCYAFNRQGASFADARRQCWALSPDGYQATLPIITSAEQDAALLRLVNGHVMRLGLVRGQAGRWLWEDGTEPRYTHWLETPPAGQGLLCAVVDGRRGGWAAQDCGNTVPFYCQARPVPDDELYEDYEYED